MTKQRTNKQKERQLYRESGKYALVNPCYACGKSAGLDFYSHPLTDTGNWDDIALVLCKKCAIETEDMVNVEEFLEYKKMVEKQ